MASKLTFLLSVARTFIVTCNVLLKKIVGRKLMDFEKHISNFLSLGRGLTNQSTNQNSDIRQDLQILDQDFKSLARCFKYAAGYLKSNGKQHGEAICQYILMALVFFYLVNLRNRFDPGTFGRISEPKKLDRENVD